MSDEKVSPMPGQVYQLVEQMDTYDAQCGRYDTTDLDAAQVITSRVAGVDDQHKLIIDLDLPAQLIPSSTPGHFHLYIDKTMSRPAWESLLYALSSAGVIEPGYMRASIARGFTAVRLPWVKKETTS